MDIREIVRRVKDVVSSNALLAGTIIGAVSGFLLGLLLKRFQHNEVITSLVGYPGELFMRALQLLIIPVVVISLIAGSSSLNIKTNGKIALRTFLYFLLTSLANAALGISLAIMFQPGDSSIKAELTDISTATIEERKNSLLDNFLDMGRQIVPNNIFTSFFEMPVTVYKKRPGALDEYTKSLDSRRGTNAIGLIFYALMFGTFMSILEEKAKPLRDVIQAVDEVNMKTISSLIWLTPFGVASLICIKVIEIEDMGQLMSSLAMFIITVFVGITIYQIIGMQLLYFIFLRKNPFKFYTGVLPAAVTGFAVDSSSAAMPVTLRCMDEVGIDTRISHFVVPIGVICNMDGTALFISIASVFIAQMNSIPLGSGDYITIGISATAVSIATAGAPSASLTLLPIILNAIGAPLEDIALLFAIDWLCDRMRTTNNVLGDCYAAAIIEHWSHDELSQQPIKSDRTNSIKVDTLEMTQVLPHEPSGEEERTKS
ncbi:Excitatory amino acid transporter 2 [Orchesella cincta]|uniref:Amino acid transporter n=1 Tax=Orchesella cincta TaxID=48709 RepID=A0A1D2ME93_ORCCI|nr:Excitatory amino acid transporter 2 [Orchesella cincta]